MEQQFTFVNLIYRWDNQPNGYLTIMSNSLDEATELLRLMVSDSSKWELQSSHSF